ncbi:hypothetical protein [Microvirgula aerodenitrificans]|uniref:hypothetical protein n=1 Tax=Microvirgula aerodenitrificans TaxID=57480 RepID=UPI00248EDC41|nr:hypothetical protein [Microvirgula aerodenitrificans]
MTDHTYAGHTAKQLRMMAEAVKYIDAATVLALLDRIAELEQRVETVEGWHFTETSRADELQESIYGDRDEIAGLRARIAELEADNSEYEAFVNECRFMSPGDDVPLHGLADRMRADKRALRIDAERYRWIRDKERFHIDGECGDAAFSSSMCCAEEFDDALDDAMAQPAE